MDAALIERFVTNVTDAQKKAAPRAARTVRNPAVHTDCCSPEAIATTPEGYQWGRQESNYLAIKKILEKFNAPPLLYVGSEPVGATGGRKQFVAVNEHKEDPSFIWHKSESYAEGSGQNYVYFGGLYIKVTDFIAKFGKLTLEESKVMFQKIHTVEIPRILKIDQDWENKKRKEREAREAFVHPAL